MVRVMAGTLIAIETGKREPGSIPAILDARDRNAAGQTAPASGLCLWHVYYENHPDLFNTEEEVTGWND